jgi:predicted nucleic acid-binding protein
MGRQIVKYLVDSNIIIYHFNGEELATTFLLKHYQECAISQITYIESLSFSFSEEDETSAKTFLDGFRIIDVNSAIAKQAICNRKIKKVKIADNIIAATAQVNGLVLVTRNVDDFKPLDVKAFNIFEDSL